MSRAPRHLTPELINSGEVPILSRVRCGPRQVLFCRDDDRLAVLFILPNADGTVGTIVGCQRLWPDQLGELDGALCAALIALRGKTAA